MRRHFVRFRIATDMKEVVDLDIPLGGFSFLNSFMGAPSGPIRLKQVQCLTDSVTQDMT